MDWHRLFGLVLTDFFTDSPFVVELEKDLSKQRQPLDVVILRRAPGPFAGRLPDGLDNLVAHNLITFKSHHDALDDWALKEELTGHYVNYRKQCTPRKWPLLPEADFHLYAVCSRYPHNLANHLTLEPVQAGVYGCKRGTDQLRIVVAGQVAEEPHNALWHLFSASAERIDYGAGHYKQRAHNTSAMLGQLLGNYRGEGIVMSYTMADFQRDYAKEHFKDLTPNEQQEVLRGLSAEQRLAGLSPEEIAKYLKKLQSEPPSRKGKPRRKS